MTWVCIALLVVIALLALFFGYSIGRVAGLAEENELLNQKVVALEKALDEENELFDRRVSALEDSTQERKNNLTEK